MKTFTFILSIVTFASFASPFTIYTSRAGLISTKVNCIEKGENFIWVGTNAGINRIVFKGKKPIKFSPRGTSVPVTALEDDGEVIWVGLKGKGVYRMPKKNYKFIGFRKDVLGDKEIKGIERVEGGVNIFTKNTKYTFKFGTEEYKSQGLKIEYGSWIGFTAGGKDLSKSNGDVLTRFNTPTQSIREFKDKIVANNFIKFKNGALIASPSGLVYYNPEKDSIQFGDPTLNLKNFHLNGEDTVTENLDLNWDDYVFRYQFSFSELGKKEQIDLHYSLNGPDGEFKGTTDALDGIELKGLDYGDYELSVSAINEKNIASKNELTFKFSIANPLKDSIWRYIIIGIVVGIWTLIVIVLTRVKFKKDIIVLEDALLEKTNKLNQIEKGKYGLVEEDEINL